jgi:hypothetical protein
MSRARVLTDVTGDFNRVVLEYEVDDLAGFEAQMHQYSNDAKFREQVEGIRSCGFRAVERSCGPRDPTIVMASRPGTGLGACEFTAPIRLA